MVSKILTETSSAPISMTMAGDSLFAAIADESSLFTGLAAQKGVEDIVLNADGKLWVNRTGQGFALEDEFSNERAHALLSRFAYAQNLLFSPESPTLETDSPIDGSRITGVTSPITRRTIIAVRPQPKLQQTIDSYELTGVLGPRNEPDARYEPSDFADLTRGKSTREILTLAILQRRNIIVAGAPTAGKTQLVNMLAHAIGELTPRDRVISIEDTAELCLNNIPNRVSLLSTTTFPMFKCLRTALRLSAKRLIVGEVRDYDNAALAMLNAWNTGHPGGIATVHADHAFAALSRLEQLIPIQDRARLCSTIAQAVNLIAFIAPDSNSAGRRVSEIINITGYDASRGQYKYEYL